MKFFGNVVIVTGAAKGIGKETARHFCREGATVILADIDDAHGVRAAEEAKTLGGAAQFVHCDVSLESDVLCMIEGTVKRYGTVDILVNNAAVQPNKGILATTAGEFRRVMDVNMTGTFLCTREVAKVMIDQKKSGAVVNVASTFAVTGSPGYLAYHASKGAVASFTRAAAVALMPHGIRVNAVAPGTTDTPGLADGARDTGDLKAGLAGFLALQPLGRFGRPEEIAQIILMLAGSEASFVYGAVWMADGGYTIV